MTLPLPLPQGGQVMMEAGIEVMQLQAKERQELLVTTTN